MGDGAMGSDAKQASRRWFAEVRFGLFIHWGLYALTGRDVWRYSVEEVDPRVYERLIDRFDPVDYDPVAWAKLARQAGMKYAVLTTKHHDGFCLWDTQTTDFKATNTPYGRDIVRPWVEACRAEGLGVGLYYSLLDWHHPHFTVDALHPQRRRMDELNATRDFDRYVEYMHEQVRELMTGYGRIDIFWADGSYGPPRVTVNQKHAPHWRSERLIAMLEDLQPGILINNRLGLPGELPADFATPEQRLPDHDLADERTPLWETCRTIGSSWGYYRNDPLLKSAQQIVADLVACVSNNGNLLLNVGPTARGRIEPAVAERLAEVGAWLDLHGESIYGAGAAAFPPPRPLPAKSSVTRYTRRGRDLYLHFIGNYPSADITLLGLGGGQVDYVEFVADRTDVPFSEVELAPSSRAVWNQLSDRPADDADAAAIRLHLPAIAPGPCDTVVHLVLKS
jgi:alpha-L-fucosidase